MAQSTEAFTATQETRRRGQRTALPAAFPLGWWRLRRTWGLLLVAQLGLIVAVLLVSAVPIFALVSVGAGFQGELAANPGDAVLNAGTGTDQPTQALVDEYARRLDGIRSGVMRPFHLGQPRLLLNTLPLLLNTGGSTSRRSVSIIDGAPAQTLVSDLGVLQGRLPHPRPDALEVVVGAATAAALHLAPGTVLPLGAAGAGAQTPVVRVVGIVALATPTFSYPLNPQKIGGSLVNIIAGVATPTFSYPLNPQAGFGPPLGSTTYYPVVTSNEAILAYSYDWSQVARARPSGSGPPPLPVWQLKWTAPMDLSHLSAQDLGAILDSDPQRLSNQLYQLINGGAAPPSFQPGFGLGGGGGTVFSVSSPHAESPLLQALQVYSARLIGAQILAGLLLADVLGLVLIFLAQMARMLVDGQEPLIALLRSRGASRGQIFGAFAVQTLVLGIVGLVAGATLALPATRIVSSALLPASERSALTILNGSLVAVSTGAAIAAVLTAVALVLAMLRSVGRASALNALALRQESTRPARKPLWQRLYLDVAAALLAFLAYGTYAAADRLATGAGSSGPSDVGVALSPLAVIAPAFLMVAGALLFLRLFPLLLRVAERMASSGGSVAPVLALAQLARSARKTASIVLPLALATCFLLFVLAANTTIEQQMADAAAFQAGADFSGGVAPVADTSAAARQARADEYLRVPGVLSASLGYRGVTLTVHCDPNTQDCGYTEYDTVQIEAVDAESFSQTAIWPAQDAAQPLAPLMAQLAAARDAASARGAIPVILDSYCARLLGVAPGASFTLPAPVPADSGTANLPDMRFSVVAVVPYLPGLYGGSGGGLLADYATFAAVYRQVMSGEIAPNFVWLRTAGDAASLARVRAAIASGPLALSRLESVPEPVPVSDRRALAASLHGDPLRLTVTGILDLGAVAALLLALGGALIASGVAARERRTALALLRALGTAPRRVRATIAWEQGIVYTVALALGALLGAVLIAVMLPPLPTLIFASALGGPIENGAPPIRIIWPWPALAAVLGALLLISALATTLAARAASRPSLAALLRLSGE
jgi:hypothetical protein